jgi:hypothetical protein
MTSSATKRTPFFLCGSTKISDVVDDAVDRHTPGAPLKGRLSVANPGEMS